MVILSLPANAMIKLTLPANDMVAHFARCDQQLGNWPNKELISNNSKKQNYEYKQDY